MGGSVLYDEIMNNLVILPVYSLFLEYGVCRCLMMKEWFGCLSLSDTFLSQFFGFFSLNLIYGESMFPILCRLFFLYFFSLDLYSNILCRFCFAFDWNECPMAFLLSIFLYFNVYRPFCSYLVIVMSSYAVCAASFIA